MVVDESIVVEESVPSFANGSESDKWFRRDTREDLFHQLPWKLLLVLHYRVFVVFYESLLFQIDDSILKEKYFLVSFTSNPEFTKQYFGIYQR